MSDIDERTLARVNDFYVPLKARAGEIERRYRELTPGSAALYERAKKRIPGGFGRDAITRKPYAPYIVEGKGDVLIDADGRRIVDFTFNATSLPLGHADARVVAAVEGQARKGSAYYAPTEREIALAELVGERLPCAERVRFTNSGSEAVMMALRIARGFTGRDLVIKFEGSYHGTYDDVQWSVTPPKDKAGASAQGIAIPDTAGLPKGEGRVLVLPYNDLGPVEAAVAKHGAELAAVIVEPMANRMGLIYPDPDFLPGLRRLCDRCGAVLIFDEVIAFRLGYRGCQGIVGVTPDVATIGKCIGGGYPVGAVAGRADIMGITDIARKPRVTHAGTFNANPVTMVAGKATMDALAPEVFDSLNATGERVRARLREICAGLPLRVTGAGSLFKINATSKEIRDYRGTASTDGEWHQTASLALLNEGYFLSKGLQGCVATATPEAHIEGFLAAFARLARS